MRLPRKYRVFAAVSFIVLLAGCSQDDKTSASKSEPAAEKIDTPYSVWVTKETITGDFLSRQLAMDPSFGDQFCSVDIARPAGYKTTFALISTHEYDRVDLIERYAIDIDKGVTWGDTGVKLTDDFEAFIKQTGKVNIEDPRIRKAALETIKITFSKEGRFSGYCDAAQRFFFSVHSDRSTGEMGLFSVQCDNPETTIACMSIK